MTKKIEVCALSRGLFRTFACGSFRSWTISPLPQSVPRKNPNYLRDTAAQEGWWCVVSRAILNLSFAVCSVTDV